MKLVFVKVEDPIAWRRPDQEFFEEDKKYFVCGVVRTGGILVHETDKEITLAEISLAADNPQLHEYGVEFPRYRDVAVILKKNIIERQDFEIKEK